MQKKDRYSVAVVGATGAVGREMVEVLEERQFPVSTLSLLASDRSEGERLQFQGRSVTVKRLTSDSFDGVDIALFFAGSERTREFASAATDAGAVVIDGCGAYATDPDVPLVVPEINPEALERTKGIIACPDASTISLVMALNPIHAAVRIKRAVVTSFQSVSGSGKAAMDELAGQTVALLNFRNVEKKVYPYQIAFNCLPHVGSFEDSGYTKEESRIGEETRRILQDQAMGITVTAVRVPVFRSHAESVNLETEKPLSANEARALIAEAKGVVVFDDPQRSLYPVPIDAVGKDDVYVGRIRQDASIPNGLNLWIVSDNLLKGAALNVAQIAELLIR